MRRTRLATQVALLTTAVTVVAVAISFVVSDNLIRRSAQSQARAILGHYAVLVADATRATGGAGGGGLRRRVPGVLALFRADDISVLRVAPNGTLTARVAISLPPAVITKAAAGQPVDERAELGSTSYFVEGRPNANGSGSVVLIQPTSAAGRITSPLRTRVLIALAIGLAVAVLAGALLARRLARPLVHAAGLAGQLASGRRDVALVAEGPAEVAAVGEALNDLAAALSTSEARQRDFLLSVSHELRTPLTAIAGYAEALADDVVPSGEVATVGQTMRGEAHRLQRLVDDLLELARVGAADFQVVPGQVDLGALVQAARPVWASRCAAAGVQLRVEAPDPPVRLVTDPGRVRQILDGLAENALRVTPPGAPLVLAARGLPGGAGQLEVRDGGPGLSDDDIGVAFEPSALYDRYRGSRRVGTGIGLALIGGLAARLGGRAEAGHAAEGGARFTVTLASLHPPNIG